ncbi:hypothetical protein Ancab_034367 [Ancistrocladus abbreviatus]
MPCLVYLNQLGNCLCSVLELSVFLFLWIWVRFVWLKGCCNESLIRGRKVSGNRKVESDGGVEVLFGGGKEWGTAGEVGFGYGVVGLVRNLIFPRKDKRPNRGSGRRQSNSHQLCCPVSHSGGFFLNLPNHPDCKI